MAKFPMLPLWTDAYLADTTHLTTLQHGAYLLLLITMWRAKGCRLHDDDKLLAKYTRTTPVQWAKLKPVLENFFIIKDGWWRNKRINKEIIFVNRKRRQRVAAGHASALKKKNRGSTSVDFPCHETSTPTPTPTPTPTKKVKEPSDELNAAHLPLDWKPTKASVQFAWEKGFSNSHIEIMLEKFKTYWFEASGKKASKSKKDWNRAWKNWVEKDIEFNGRPKDKRPTKNQIAG